MSEVIEIPHERFHIGNHGYTCRRCGRPVADVWQWFETDDGAVPIFSLDIKVGMAAVAVVVARCHGEMAKRTGAEVISGFWFDGLSGDLAQRLARRE
jgi:hypothetical protein